MMPTYPRPKSDTAKPLAAADFYRSCCQGDGDGAIDANEIAARIASDVAATVVGQPFDDNRQAIDPAEGCSTAATIR
jgi:hypothetical protein